jgi:uncharacterized protein YjbI with pentapeptide repeats
MSLDDHGTIREQHAPPRDFDSWNAYWRSHGQSWRTEPEIDDQRQRYLVGLRAITPDIERGRYPFAGVQLTRANIEWLLATHEDGRGPVDWSDLEQRQREGLDLRGADLHGVDLSDLPMARARGGLTLTEWQGATREQRTRSVLRLEQADLSRAHLEGACLTGAVLYAAWLTKAHLEESILDVADLMWAQLEEADLRATSLVGAHLAAVRLPAANLEGADLSEAHLQGANLNAACLYNAKLGRAQLQGANLSSAELARATFNATDGVLATTVPASQWSTSGARLEGAVLDFVLAQATDFRWAHLEGVSMIVAQLEGADLSRAVLDGANLSGCYLEGANLHRARLEGVNFSDGRRQHARDAAHLAGADLREAVLQGACLRGVDLAGAQLAGASLERTDLRGAQVGARRVPPKDLKFIRIGCPDFPTVVPPADLEGAIMDETTGLPSRPRPPSRYPWEGAYKLGREKPRGGEKPPV